MSFHHAPATTTGRSSRKGRSTRSTKLWRSRRSSRPPSIRLTSTGPALARATSCCCPQRPSRMKKSQASTVDGHSLVFSHDRPAVTEPMPRLPDSAEPIGDRRRLAQWLFSRDETAAMLRALPDDAVPPSIAIPDGWPRPESDDGTSGAGDDPDGDPDAGPDGDLPNASDAASDAEEERNEDNQAIVRVSLTHDMNDETATVDDQKADPPVPQETGPWSPEVVAVLRRLSRAESQADGEAWLESQIAELRTALQTENVDAPILGQRLTPNTGLVYVGGRTLTTGWLERKQRDLLTRYGLDIVRISPMPGQIAIGLPFRRCKPSRRPARPSGAERAKPDAFGKPTGCVDRARHPSPVRQPAAVRRTGARIPTRAGGPVADGRGDGQVGREGPRCPRRGWPSGDRRR